MDGPSNPTISQEKTKSAKDGHPHLAGWRHATLERNEVGKTHNNITIVFLSSKKKKPAA
jgi:hypothetical protein